MNLAPRPVEPIDVDVVRRSQGGDRVAFTELHERYGRVVHAVLLARVTAQEAQDLVQEVFLTAWERLVDLRDLGAFGPWLVRIARNLATDSYRRRRALVELPPDVPAPEVPTAECNQILAIVRTLPEAYRETLLMRLVEGMTGPEIALRAGLTEGSVRVNLHRGMKLLHERLGSDHER